MQLILELLAGGGYLANKIFLSISERERLRGRPHQFRRWRIASWAVYLVSLPPWIIIFAQQRNWIAASVEASGAPAMILGFITALRGTTTDPPRWLDHLALICIPLGFGYSVYDFGGITQLTQWLEIGLVIGFLVGTYQLAKEQPAGYGWYVLMHGCCGWLLWLQAFPWLVAQQLLSLIFIIDAWRISQQP